jgi:acetaldehyde dehydrogenase (acetylating)
MQTIGVIREDKVNKVMEIAEPVGLLMGIIPSTNPTSTTIYKSIIAIKSRNGIVFSPHPSALKCTLQAARLMNDAAVAAGAPPNIIGCISKPSMGATNELMKCDEVALIIDSTATTITFVSRQSAFFNNKLSIIIDSPTVISG